MTVPPKTSFEPAALNTHTSTPTQQNTGASHSKYPRGAPLECSIDDCFHERAALRPQHSGDGLDELVALLLLDRTSHDVVGLMHARGRKRVSNPARRSCTCSSKATLQHGQRRILLRAMRSRASAAAGRSIQHSSVASARVLVSWRTTRQTPAGLTPGLSPMRSRAVCSGSRTKAIVHVMVDGTSSQRE